MGWLSKTYKKAEGKLKSVATSKNLAIVAPYYSAFTTSGRAALKDTYGGIGAGLVNSYTGGKGGGFFTAVLDKVSPETNLPKPPTDDGGGGGGGGGYSSYGAGSGSGGLGGIPTWGWAIGAVVIVGGLVLYLARKR